MIYRLIIYISLFAQIGWASENFAKKVIKIGTRAIRVEIADTESKRQRGLMFRKKLDKDTGMLFIFPHEQPLSFWMKNTFIDLDIGFFDRHKKLINIVQMEAVKSEMDQSLPSYSSERPAQYALEVPKFWFKENKIKLGTKLHL